MDGQVIIEISNSETLRDIKKLEKIHPNWYIFLVILDFWKKILTAKLSAPCPFVFWTQNGRHLLNFAATKKFRNIFFTRKIFQLGSVFLSFCSGFIGFWVIYQNAIFFFHFYPTSWEFLLNSLNWWVRKWRKKLPFCKKFKKGEPRAKT